MGEAKDCSKASSERQSFFSDGRVEEGELGNRNNARAPTDREALCVRGDWRARLESASLSKSGPHSFSLTV